ncbi:MAG: hypothetical protein DWC09_08580 [Candidatus Poseidoniales archaeon]|nr:MAG: hypothetical protein DWC09_08580 [Candidatus Poseidoniales archaeon]
MRRKIPVLAVLLCILLFPQAATETADGYDLVASTPLPEQRSADTVLYEHFLPLEGPYETESNEDLIQLSWWKWSDETNSDWPDDDAKARLGELGLSDDTTMIFNEQKVENVTIADGLATGLESARQQTVLTLEGSIDILSDELGQWSIRIPVQMMPLVNMSDNTVLYIFITEDTATDQHGRTTKHLVRDMKPELGFSNKQGNMTDTEWLVTADHLMAAGVDLEQNPYGWHITLAFFGEVEGESTNRLLALYHSPLPNRWHASTPGNFALPLFLLIFASAIAAGAVSNAMKREKGMPRLSAEWKTIQPPVARFTFNAGNLPLQLKSCVAELPWGMKGGFKIKQIPADSEYEFVVRFKEIHSADCQVSFGLEVDELGTWTQYLRLTSPLFLSEGGEGSVEIDEPGAAGGEHHDA